MKSLLEYGRRHWPALLVMVFFIWRSAKAESPENVILWICTGLGIGGMALNLIVILVNGGMPVAMTAEELDEEDQPLYRPIDESTRLAVLSDWIPLGNSMISPGDVLLVIAAAILLLRLVLDVSGF